MQMFKDPSAQIARKIADHRQKSELANRITELWDRAQDVPTDFDNWYALNFNFVSQTDSFKFNLVRRMCFLSVRRCVHQIIVSALNTLESTSKYFCMRELFHFRQQCRIMVHLIFSWFQIAARHDIFLSFLAYKTLQT